MATQIDSVTRFRIRARAAEVVAVAPPLPPDAATRLALILQRAETPVAVTAPAVAASSAA